MMSEPANVSRRMPAEWECDSAILLAWPHADTDWADMLDEVTACYVELVKAIVIDRPVIIVAPDTSLAREALAGVDQSRIVYLDLPTNDTWTRDYGPITVEQSDGSMAIADYTFNGWGLKFAADRDNMVTLRMMAKGLLQCRRINRLGFALEGGSIDSDGHGTILTTAECLLSPNRNGALTRAEIEAELRDTLGAERVVWLANGALAGDDTDSHVDTLARFTSSGAVVYAGCSDPSDPNYHHLARMKEELLRLSADGQLPHLLELPSPSPIFDEDGQQLPATYANFLATPTAVLMPTYGQPDNDRLARQILEVAFGLPVREVDCRALIRQHGSLHCATMQIPLDILAFA